MVRTGDLTMELARVTGSVTATMKDAGLAGLTLLLVERVDAAGMAVASVEVATDSHGAGAGDLVLVVRGSAARQPSSTRSLPTDLTVVAIVDSVDRAKQAAPNPTKSSKTPGPRKQTARSKS